MITRPHRLWHTIVLAVLSCTTMVLAYPPFYFWPMIFIIPTVLTWLALNAVSTRRAIMTVIIVQSLAWLWINRWLIDVTIVGYPFLGIYLSFYAAMFVWIIRRCASHSRFGHWPMTLIVPAFWTGLELLRGRIAFNGYPWFLLGHPLIEWPVLVQSADLFGTYFISFLVAMMAGGLVDFARYQRKELSKRLFYSSFVTVLVIITANVAYGMWRMKQIDQLSTGPTVLVVQTNLGLGDKLGWTLEDQTNDLSSFMQQTKNAVDSYKLQGREIDLIVWPETMLPGFGLEKDGWSLLNEINPDANRFTEKIIRYQRDLQIPILAGSNAYTGWRRVEDVDVIRAEWDAEYNSAYLINGDLPFQRSDKHYLTPFGEVMPVISNWEWLEQKLAMLGARDMSFDLSSGEISRLRLEWRDSELEFGVPICFEDSASWVCRRMTYDDSGEKRGGVLINLSNSNWFGNSDETRAQHAQIARFRCIENRIPLIRSANTGYSVLVDSNGNVVTTVGEGRYGQGRVTGNLLVSLSLDGRSTLFGRIGDLVGWLCLVATILLLAGTYIGWTGYKKQ